MDKTELIAYLKNIEQENDKMASTSRRPQARDYHVGEASCASEIRRRAERNGE